MSRRIVMFSVVAAAMLAATLAPVRAQTVTLNWLEWWEPEYGKEVMDGLTQRFEEKTGIHVERTPVPWGSMYDLLLTNAQGGTATYDVLGMEGCCFLTGIDKLGGLEPLGPYLDSDPDFAKGLTDLTVVSYRNRPLMLNWYIFPYSYVYNIAIFEAAGIEAPTNWNEMVEASKKLAQTGSGKYAFGEGFAGDPHHVAYYLFGSRLAQLGGRFLDEKGSAVFNSPAGVQALKDWKAFYDSGVFMPGALGMMFANAREALAAGSIAGMFDGPFALIVAKQISPDIRLAFPPAWKEGASGGYVWAGSGLAISSNSAHKKEAWEFIKFLLSDEVAVEMTKKVGIPFATKAALATLEGSDDPILGKIPAMMNQDPAHNFFLLPVPEQETLHREFVVMFQDVMAGNKEPQKALDDLAAFWNAELQKPPN